MGQIFFFFLKEQSLTNMSFAGAILDLNNKLMVSAVAAGMGYLGTTQTIKDLVGQFVTFLPPEMVTALGVAVAVFIAQIIADIMKRR